MTDNSKITFRTPIKITSAKEPWLSHAMPIVSFGSCFSNEIGKLLRMRLFDIDINPFGILYNPVSIATAIDEVLEKKVYTEKELLCDDMGKWHSMMHHSVFSSADSELTLIKINDAIRKAHDYFRQKDAVVIITFGSARCFILKSLGKVVGNCHKLPSSLFELKDLEIDEIINLYGNLIQKIIGLNPNVKFIFTVSPIRHLSYGMHEDKISKSKLLVATDILEKTFENVYYFPAYEIMDDDLRDYRFYAEDMLHPSMVAVEYIYTIFEQMFMTPTTVELNKECLKLTKRLSHRSADCIDLSTQDFLRTTHEMARRLAAICPSIQKAINSFKDEK